MKLLEVPETPARPPGKKARSWRDYDWLGMAPFVAVHLAPFGALWTGVRWQDWLCCAVLLWVRLFGVTGGYHRYFAHRTYKTSRAMQFLLALLAQTSSQKGVLWWAAHHRQHHRHSDTERDPHSPIINGFWYSHVGWLYDDTAATDYHRVKDLARYPELVVLNKLWFVPPLVLGFTVWLLLGWSGLFIGFALSTVLCWHGTFAINSLTHMVGKQRFQSRDRSLNHWLLALLTLGEGWHNNHHFYQSSTRQGFYWWEVDITYYVLKLMNKVGLVWELREPPARVYELARGQRAALTEAQPPAASIAARPSS